MADKRTPLWKADILQAQRRRRMRWIVAIGAVLITLECLAFKVGWSPFLDWTVIAIPAIVGIVAWVIPVREAQAIHKWMLTIGCIAFSALLYFQQYLTRREHAIEIANLPTKDDIARIKVPSAKDIVREMRNQQTEEVRKEPGVTIKSKPKSATKDNQDTGGISAQLNEIKSMLADHWGLNAEQLLTLSRRVAPYASLDNRGDLITSIMGNPDSTRFASALVAAFRSAGWNLPGSGFNQAVFSGNVEGVIIKLHSKEDKPPGLLEVVTSLREAGIQPVGEIDEKIPANRFQIIIGGKPS